MIGHHLTPESLILTLTAAAVGMYGAGAASELGSTFHDLTLSVPMLASLAVLFDSPKDARMRTLAASGVLLGLAIGFKLTMAIYAPGSLLAVLILVRGRQQMARALAWACGLAVGFLITGGYWTVYLLNKFGNPVGF